MTNEIPHRSRTHTRFLVPAVVASVALVVSVSFIGPERGSFVSAVEDGDRVLDTVDPALLKSTNDIVLEKPMGTAKVTSADAADFALAADPELFVVEVKLATVRAGMEIADGCLCWVVAMRSADGTIQRIPAPGVIFGRTEDNYYLTFVDASTGALLFSAQGGRQVEPNRADPEFKIGPVETPSGNPPETR